MIRGASPLGEVVGLLDAPAAHLARFDAGPDGLIYTGAAGRPVGRNRVAEVVQAAATRADARTVRFHDVHRSTPRPDPQGPVREGRPGEARARLGGGDARRVQAPLARRRGPHLLGRRRELLGNDLTEDWLRTEAGE
jgi:hypothetical protein